MPKSSPSGASEEELYRLYDLLDRFEELLEDMADLGVRSVEEIEARLTQLNAEIDAAENADAS